MQFKKFQIRYTKVLWHSEHDPIVFITLRAFLISTYPNVTESMWIYLHYPQLDSIPLNFHEFIIPYIDLPASE